MNKINVNESVASIMGRDTTNGKKWEDYDTIKLPDGSILDMAKLIHDQATAKAALIHLEPMFAAFANKLVFVYTFHIDTQATDGYHLFVNPVFTAGLTFEQKVFVMAHECMHCLLDHMRRGLSQGHDPEKSNIAADYEVNDTLVDLELFNASTIKAADALYDTKYTKWSYERIYDSNPPGPSKKQYNNGKKQNKNGQNGQSGQGSGSGQNNEKKSAEYVKGWNQAMADYKAGKLKI